MRKILQILFSIFLLLFSITDVYSLEKTTHEALNENIANISGINSYLINRLGFPDGLKTNFNKKWAIRWIMDGGKAEDEPLYTRSFNHFHNPLKTWDTAGFKGTFQSSVIWAQEQGTFGSLWGGDWSWKKARDFFYKGLTSTTNTDREKNLADTFRAVGQVMHLVEDASVPAHTRDDAHIVGYHYELAVDKFRMKGDPVFTDALTRPITFDPAILSLSPNTVAPIPIAKIFDIDKYNSVNPDPNVTASRAIGLSEYTNANFVSEGLLSANFQDFPYPRIADTTIVGKSYTGSFGEYTRQYYKKNCCGETNEGQGYLLSAVDYLDYWRQKFPILSIGLPKIPVLDDNVYKDYASLLIPRAVGYSAGLLNYFFRGNIGIELDQNSPDELVVMNLSSERMTGTFSLYYDDSNNNRNFVKGWGLDIMPYSPEYVSLSSCDLSNLSPKPEKFILVFQGTMGNETGAVVGNTDITSLKTTSCGTELTVSGPDAITKNTSQPYTVSGCTGCSDDLTWSASGTGADIDEAGHLSASDTACGTVTINAECSKCNSSSSKNIKVSCDPLTIIGPDLVEKNKTYNYKAEGCCEDVEWYVLGIGATIIPDGTLITDETLTGLITVVAICQKCDTFATKDVKTLCDPEIAITGSDTIAKSDMQQYTASGCNKPVAWSVDGKATITETGLLVTDETACGSLTVKAQCPECEPPATKNVQITCDPLTITGSDTTTRNSTKQYTAEGCCGEVQWSVSGKGARIEPQTNGEVLLKTDNTACGSLTITASCPACSTTATKKVRVTDAGRWSTYDSCGKSCAVWCYGYTESYDNGEHWVQLNVCADPSTECSAELHCSLGVACSPILPTGCGGYDCIAWGRSKYCYSNIWSKQRWQCP